MDVFDCSLGAQPNGIHTPGAKPHPQRVVILDALVAQVDDRASPVDAKVHWQDDFVDVHDALAQLTQLAQLLWQCPALHALVVVVA